MIRKHRILCSLITGALLIIVLAGCSVKAKPDGNASTAGTEPPIQQTQAPAPESSAASSAGSDSKDGLSIGGHRNVKPGGSYSSGVQLMSVDSADLNWWKLTCTQLSGWETRGFTFTGDSSGKCVLQVDVTAKAGELDITVMDPEGTTLDTYKNVASSTFDIDLGKGGDYQIRVDGQKFDGSLSIEQKS